MSNTARTDEDINKENRIAWGEESRTGTREAAVYVFQECERGAAGEDVRFRSGSAPFRWGTIPHRGGGG